MPFQEGGDAQDFRCVWGDIKGLEEGQLVPAHTLDETRQTPQNP